MPPARKSPVIMRDAAPTPSAKRLASHPQRALPLAEPKAPPEKTKAPPEKPKAPPEKPKASPPKTVTAAVPRRLWFCIHLPNLPLEASGSGDEARAVVEERQGIHRVLLASGKAEAAGVMSGQSANAALALLPELRILERSRLCEQQALENLAAWLEQFTSVVCFAGADALLVEIAGSLRLYGGLLKLRQQIALGLGQQGFRASLAIAPTPLAATWLARSGHRACIRESGNLATALRSLSLHDRVASRNAATMGSIR